MRQWLRGRSGEEGERCCANATTPNSSGHCFSCTLHNTAHHVLLLLRHLMCSAEKQQVSAFFDGSGTGSLRWTYQVRLFVC